MNSRKISPLLLLACISTILFFSHATTAHTQDIFYFLSGDSIELYDRHGVFQKSYPVPIHADVWRSALATDGVDAWLGYFSERDQIDRMALATAPGLSGGIIKEPVPSGYLSDVALHGNSLFVTRFLNNEAVYSRVEEYDTTDGTLTNSFGTGYRSFPDAVTIADGNIFVATLSNVSVYTMSGDLIRQFTPDNGVPTNMCSSDTYLWFFYGDNIGYAFDFSGNRVPGEDITFQGLSSYDGADMAWGPDGPNIMTPEDSLIFDSSITGESETLDLVIQNVGNESLTVTDVSLSDTTNFSHTVELSFSLPAGGSQTFTVTFNPTVTGILNATITLTSNDPDEPTFAISLTGKGTSGRFYVDGSRQAGGNGLNWYSAFDSIDSAMASPDVLDNSEIWVRSGTYDPVTLNKAVDVYGGFYGNETSLSQRDWEANETIIDGGSASRPVNITAEAANGVLDGFIIQNGYTADYTYGGGIEILASGFSLVNSTIRDNSSGSVGGGAYTGSGVENVSITNCIFSNNSARGTNSGGGLYAYPMGLLVSDSTFIGNSANSGGGIFLNGWSNTTYDATITRCTLGGNSATYAGGAIFSSHTSLILSSSLIHDNTTAYQYGEGAIKLSSGANSQIINNTIVNNRTPDGTGGYGIQVEYVTATTLTNNIIWANGKMHYLDPMGNNNNFIQISDRTNGAGLTVSSSNVQDQYYGDWTTGDPDANYNMRKLPGFVDVDGADDDPATWQDNDYRLQAGSYCIDYGDGDTAPATDIYNNPRFDDTAISNSGTGSPTYVDIGSHERQSHTPLQFYVDAAATGAGTGESWTDALTSINKAAEMAVDGAEIWVRAGTYLLDAPIEINGEVELYGGFSGTEGSRYQRDWVANPTIIDGQQSVEHCISIFDDAVVDGFTITGGGIPGHWEGGGGIMVEQASPIISHNTIRNNSTASYGGGIYINEGPGTIIDSCAIIENTTTEVGYSTIKGGGIYLQGSDGTIITNSLIAGNLSGMSGGAISSYGGFSLINSTVASNRGYNSGGITQSAGHLTVTNSIVYGNTAHYTSDQIYYDTLDATFSNIQGGETGTGNIDLSPDFVDNGSWDNNGTSSDLSDDSWTKGDYYLQWGSPSIDTGTATGAPDFDIELTARPQSTGFDMGAYEIVPPVPGDVNGDRDMNLEDAILALKMITGETITEPITTGGDINDDQKIGMEEVFYILNN